MESWPIQVPKVAWCSRKLITFTHAIVFMFFTQDEVSNCVFWPMDHKGHFEDDDDGLKDEWDGF